MKDIAIRAGRHGEYQDVLDAAKFHARKYGNPTNALAAMARESAMYAEWVEADVARTVETKALPPDTQEPLITG